VPYCLVTGKNGSGTQIAFHHLSMPEDIWHWQKGISAALHIYPGGGNG